MISTKFSTIVLVILLLAGAGFAADRLRSNNDVDTEAPKAQEATDSGRVVATIGDETITLAQLDKQVDRLVALGAIAPLEGAAEEQLPIKQAVLNQMIAERLLLGDARGKGISVSEEDFLAKQEVVREQAAANDQEASFEDFLAAQGLSPEEFRQALHDQLVLEAYLDDVKIQHGVHVSDEAVRQIYDEEFASKSVDGAGESIKFEDVAVHIRAKLEEEQLAQLLPALIDQLTETANVRVSL